MPYRAHFDPELRAVRGRFDGPISANCSMNYAIEVSRLMALHGCRRLLTDHRNARLDMSTAEIYEVPDIAERAGVPRDARWAVVVSTDHPDERFLETVARNKGQTLRVFRSIEEAKDWLLETSPVVSSGGTLR